MHCNEVFLLGRLGCDVDLHEAKGSSVSKFRLATNERYWDGDGKSQERTEWHDIVCFGKLADAVYENLEKGCRVFLRGQIRTREITDREGVSKRVRQIYAHNIQFIDRKRED